MAQRRNNGKAPDAQTEARTEEELAAEIERMANDRAMEIVAEERARMLSDAYQLETMKLELMGTDDPGDQWTAGIIGEVEKLSDLSDQNRGWQRVGSNSRQPSTSQLQRIQSQAEWAYHRNPLAKNIINNYTFLTMGSGVALRFRSKSAQRLWDRWARDNDWPKRSKRIVRNTYLYGAWPLVLFPLSPETRFEDTVGNPVDRSDINRARLDRIPISKRKAARREKVRGFDPRDLLDIRTDPDDRETFQAFVRSTSAGKTIYDAGDVIYPRVGNVGEAIRGRPILEPVLRYMTWTHGYVQDRVIANATRTRMPAVRKFSGISGTARVQTEGAKHNTLPRAGSILNLGAGEDWIYPDLKMGDAEPDFRILVLLIAAGVNLPEFLVIMNAATANRASLQEAADATRPMFDDYRAEFGDAFADLGERITGERGEAMWPVGERRQTKDQAQAFSIYVDDHVLSRQTVASKLGHDWRKEVDLMGEEQDELTRRGILGTSMADLGGRTPEPEDEDEDEEGAEDDEA